MRYKFNIITNNLCYGCMVLKSYDTYKKAVEDLSYYKNKYGVCEIKKSKMGV